MIFLLVGQKIDSCHEIKFLQRKINKLKHELLDLKSRHNH